jgi:DNA-binding GntR family transcriptional regulator
MPTSRLPKTAETKAPAQPLHTEADLAIDHPTLAIVVAERLRKLIASGELPPGARLNERSLCERLRVSRTPLREAYRILASEGLIEVLPKRGARVVEMSAADIADVFDLLAVIEGLSGRLAAEKASPAALEEIAALHRQMVAAHEARDMVRYSVVSKAVHVAINSAAGSAPLKDIYLRLNGQVQKLRYKSNLEGDNWARSVAEHARFVAALLARDGALAERLLREHLLDKKAFALAHPVADSA